MVQAGEQADAGNRSKVVESFRTLGITDPNFNIKFDDGGEFSFAGLEQKRFQNVLPTGVDKETERPFYQIDTSNPLSRRSVTVGRTLARFIGNNILGFSDEKNPRDVSAIDNTTGILVNALQTDAKDINTVYTRARELAKRAGIEEAQAKRFFDSIKRDLSDTEAEEIRRGLDIIYG